jgi:hypothetical protein
MVRNEWGIAAGLRTWEGLNYRIQAEALSLTGVTTPWLVSGSLNGDNNPRRGLTTQLVDTSAP